MILQAYSIYDSKAETYYLPRFFHNTPTFMRAISPVCNDESHQFCLHGEDFTAFHIGEFDQLTGKFTPIEPVSVCRLHELKDNG